MADNVDAKTATNVPVATRSVTYSGDAAQNVQVMGLAAFAGSDDAKTIADIGGDAAYGLDVDVNRLPAHAVDTFGQLRAGVGRLDVDVNFSRSSYTTWVTATTASGGSNTQGSGYMQQATGTTNGGTAKLVSNQTITYEPGGEVYCLITAAWLQAGAAGTAGSCYMRAGLYDTNNGFYIGFENTTFGVTVRTGGSDTQVAKASFNVDTLTGAATSLFKSAGSPVAIDLTKLNVWRIRFGWLGSAPVRFEVLSPDGEWVLFHIVRQPNSAATPHIQSPDLAITSDVKNTGTTTNLQVNMACWGAGCTAGARTDGTVPHDGVDKGNPVKLGAKAIAAVNGLTLVAAGDRTDLFADLDGGLIVRPFSGLADIVSGNASNTDGASFQVIAAGATGVKHYLTSCTITNTSTAAIYCELKDGATAKYTVPVPAQGGATISFPVPLPGSAATAWNCDPSAATTTVYCSMVAFKSKV